MTTRSLVGVLAAGLLFLTTVAVQATIVDIKRIEVNLTDAKAAAENAVWSDPQKLTVTKDGLDWEGEATVVRQGWIQTVPMGVAVQYVYAQTDPKPELPATKDAPKQADASKSALLVSLVPAKTEFTYGEPVTVRFDVKNVSKEPVGLWSRGCSWGHEVYHFEITMPDGSVVTAGEPPMGWRKNSPHTEELAPGKTFSIEFDLMRLTSGPLTPGELSVRGIYRSAGLNENDPLRLRTTGLWTGEAATEPVKFALKPAWNSKELIFPRMVWLTTDTRNNAPDEAVMIACPATKTFKAADLVCFFQTQIGGATEPAQLPRFPLAIGKVKRVYPQTAMALVAIKPDNRFDEVRIGDSAEKVAEAADETQWRKGYRWSLPAAHSENTPTERKVRFDFGPMHYVAVLDRNTENRICTLHVNRIGSRFQPEKNSYLLWETRFSSWPDSIAFKDGLIVARNQYHTWWIRPFSGNTEKMESHGDEPRLNNPNPSAANAGDSQRGEAAQGVSVRLRADRSRFGLHETPSFTLDFRNEGSRNFRVFQSPLAGSFVVDGISFGWTRGLGGKASSPFPPGRAYEGIRVSLDDGWQGDHLSGGKLTPGKHTIQYVSTLWDANVWGKSIRMPVDPNNPIHVTCTSNPLEIEIRDTDERPAPAGDHWGTPVEGVSVSLSADHFAWTADEQPTFKAKARNQGQRNLLFPRSQALGELEVDGTLYHFAGPIRVRSSAFPPGRQYDDILIMFSPAWQTQDGKPLQLGGGRHIVRFIASAEPLQKPDRSARVCARSNPVEINIEPGIGDYESMDEVLMTPGGHDVDLDSLRRAWIGTGSRPGALPDY
ncbi:MAG: hypothetical protein ACLP9L_28960 [Thermoguttaceae bacterium]